MLKLTGLEKLREAWGVGKGNGLVGGNRAVRAVDYGV